MPASWGPHVNADEAPMCPPELGPIPSTTHHQRLAHLGLVRNPELHCVVILGVLRARGGAPVWSLSGVEVHCVRLITWAN